MVADCGALREPRCSDSLVNQLVTARCSQWCTLRTWTCPSPLFLPGGAASAVKAPKWGSFSGTFVLAVVAAFTFASIPRYAVAPV